MANLSTTNSYDPIYQIEATDVFLGGAGEIANEQAQALGNRDDYTLQQYQIRPRLNLLPLLGTEWGPSGASAASSMRTLEGEVQLEGVIQSVSSVTPGTPIFTLPVAHRPLTNKYFVCYSYGGSDYHASFIQINTAGEVSYPTASGTSGAPPGASYLLTLDSIRFINKP